MSYLDALHHVRFVRLFERVNLFSRKATRDEDINSVADRWIGGIPIGLKSRGKNAGDDHNLTAWSEAIGYTKEFATAGSKLYFYTMSYGHVLVRMPEQEVLDAILPKFRPISHNGFWDWMDPMYPYGNYAGVRRESKGSPVQQGVVYVPKSLVTTVAKWGRDERLIDMDIEWYDETIKHLEKYKR